MTEKEEISRLEERVRLLEKEVQSLQDVSIFADIRPSIPEDAKKYKELKMATVNLQYRVRYTKKTIIKELYERLSRDLYKPSDEFQLLNPANGSKIDENDDLGEFIDDGGVIRLDFSYVLAHCDHHHHHEEDDDDDEFSDDENFYSSCSCDHHT